MLRDAGVDIWYHLPAMGSVMCGDNSVAGVEVATWLGCIGDPRAARPLAEFLSQPDIRGHMDRGNDSASIYSL